MPDSSRTFHLVNVDVPTAEWLEERHGSSWTHCSRCKVGPVDVVFMLRAPGARAVSVAPSCDACAAPIVAELLGDNPKIPSA